MQGLGRVSHPNAICRHALYLGKCNLPASSTYDHDGFVRSISIGRETRRYPTPFTHDQLAGPSRIWTWMYNHSRRGEIRIQEG